MSALDRRRAGIALLVALALALAFLWYRSGDRSLEDTTGITTKVDEPLAPAPDALLAEIVMPTPNASWGRLQRGIGGAVGILPASAGGIICTVAGLDPFLASEIDGAAPAFAVVTGDPASPHYLIALKLVDLRKARAGLVDGDTARYASRDAGGMTELVAKGASTLPVTVGLSPNGYLLVARAPDDLGRLGPYASRTLPKRPLPSEGAIVVDVPRGAIGSLVKPKLDEAWSGFKSFLLGEDERMRTKHGGRAPDYGDPKAIVTTLDGWVTRRTAIVSDLETLRVTVDVAEDGLAILSTMTPRAGGVAAGWTEALVLGDTTTLASLPATAAAAFVVRDSEADRKSQASEVESLVTSALGARLAEADAKKLHDVLEDYAKARTETLSGALLWDDPLGLLVRAPVRDDAAASRSVRGAVDLARVSPFKELLRVRDVTFSADELPGLGKISLATLVRERRARDTKDAGAPRADGGATPSDGLGLAWIVDHGMLSLATGDVPRLTLGAALHPERTLGQEPSIARSFAALGTQASSVLVVQPLRFDPMRANLPAAPLVVALARKDGNAILRVDVANGLLRALTRWQMGL